MKRIYTELFFALFTILFILSCQKDDPEAKSNVLFSVDLDNKWDGGIKGYIAAYSPKGELLNYASLTDSTKWELKAKYVGSKFDILFYSIIGNSINVEHIKNISIGQSFTDLKNMKSYPIIGDKTFNLKVEDFGNRAGNSTAKYSYMSNPIKRITGGSYSGEFSWQKIEDGYGYTSVSQQLDNDPTKTEKGYELILFERGTNIPYTTYIDLSNRSADKLITLNKSDFTAAQTKTIQVNAKSNEFMNMFLYTYNSKVGRGDILTSFDHHSIGNEIWYINNTSLPISHWQFTYSAKNKNTSYTISSNKELPSSFEIKELTGQAITKTGNQYKLTHSTIFANKKLARSMVSFIKCLNQASINYTIHFDSNESVGTTTVAPFKIPSEILKNNTDFIILDNSDWTKPTYGQTYTDIPNNSSLDYLKKTILLLEDNNKPTNEYMSETFWIEL